MSDKQILDLTRWILIVAAVCGVILFMGGCASENSGMGYKGVTKYADGTVKTEELTVVQPESPIEGAWLTSTTGGISAGTSGSQDQATIAGAEGDARNMGYLYIACGLLLVLAFIAYLLPDYIVKPKEATIGFVFAGAASALVVWVDASADIMGYVIPIIAVAGIGFMAWRFVVKKKILTPQPGS